MRRALFLALVIAGCGREPAAPPVDLTGTWAAPTAVPGSSFQFTLTQVGDSVTGDGTFSIEGGRQGTVTVAGRYQRPAVELEIVQDLAVRRTFVGQVEGARMTGTATDVNGQQTTLTFVKQ